jgi:transposase
VLDAILYRSITGCHWNELPEGFPDDSTVHRTFVRWRRLGIMDQIWAILLEQYWRFDEALPECSTQERQWAAGDPASKHRWGA